MILAWGNPYMSFGTSIYTNPSAVALSLMLCTLMILLGVLLNLRWTYLGHFSGVLRYVINFTPSVELMLLRRIFTNIISAAGVPTLSG